MRAAFGRAFTSDTAATISNLHFHHTAPTTPTAPTAPTTNSITATGTVVDSNDGRGIIKIDGGRGMIDIKSFKVQNEEDVLRVTLEGSKWDVSKEEA